MSTSIRLGPPFSYECPGRHGSWSSKLVTGEVTVEIVTVPNWSWSEPAPFFPPTRSRANKLILPLSGWVVLVDSVVPAGFSYKVASTRELTTVWAGTPHVFLFGPGSVVQVTTVGDVENEVTLPPENALWRVFQKFTKGDLERASERHHRTAADFTD